MAYLDLTGSGAETIAHLRQNGRITIMFCSFTETPKILRLYGTGRVVLPAIRSGPRWPVTSRRWPGRGERSPAGAAGLVLTVLVLLGLVLMGGVMVLVLPGRRRAGTGRSSWPSLTGSPTRAATRCR